MKTKRFLFVSSVVLIAALCIGVMNLKYDRLSRYPYEDEQARALINEYLNNKEISYIIEYSIAPSYFVDFIDAPGFSVYHADYYNQVRNSIWYLNNQNIVYIVELARTQMSMEQLIQYLLNYDANSVIQYLKEGDSYLNGSSLIENPYDLDVLVDDQHTLSSRILFDAAPMLSIPSTASEPVLASAVVNDAVKAMCIAIESELDNGSVCAGLMAERGYVSYDEQVQLYQNPEDALEADAPGHSEHQLGTAFDFVVKGVEHNRFDETEQYKWLKENAHRFGFVESYPLGKESVAQKEARCWHWRYVGYEKAAELYFNQLTLFEASHE